MEEFAIDPDIARARTLPSGVYHERAWFERVRDRVLARGWHAVPMDPGLSQPGDQLPWTLLPETLDEPLLLVRDDQGSIRCLSNVCTHRGNLLVRKRCTGNRIRCGYHGRRFSLDGQVAHAPGFQGDLEPSDQLPAAETGSFGPLRFVSLAQRGDLEKVLQPLHDRLGFLPLDRAVYDPKTSRTYEFQANWALYCDNYLEGFHVPFVHPGLDRVLEFGAYRTELLEAGVLQIGIASQDEGTFELPAGHPDRGQRVAGYYFWLYPTTMVNAYPWGLSVNAVLPLGPDRTRVVFSSYVWDPGARGAGAGADLHQVELEDEAVVIATQRGVRSRLYDRGRYAPGHERGVHHFHRLLAQELFAH